MKGYWHLIALSAAIVAVSIQLNQYILLLLFYIWFVLLYVFKRIKLSLVLFISLSICFFLFHLPASHQLNTSQIDPTLFPHSISGKIVSDVISTEQKIEFTLKDNQTNKKILLVHFLNETSLSKEKLATLQHGANCIVKGDVSLPNEARNPYQFDYRDYLMKKDIYYQLILQDVNDITCEGYSILQLLYTLRDNIIEQANITLTVPTQSWLYALVLGDDSFLEDEVVELFRRWGIAHVLAISGLHIGIVVGLVYILLIRFGITTKEKAQWIIIIFLPLYAVIASGQPSVWRACLMVLLVIILNKINFKYNYTDIISIIFILFLILNKFIIYHIGFQLSFAVTFGIILSRQWLNQATSNLERVLQISFVSQMMILPLQLHYFAIFQPLSILLNIIVVPFFSIIFIPLLFLLLVLINLPTVVIYPFEQIFLIIQSVFLKGLINLDKYIDYPFVIAKFPITFTVIYYVIFILLMVHLEKKQKKQAFQYGVILVIFICFLAIRPLFSAVGTVTMLDIGQGDAYIIELPYRKGVYFVDAGTPLSFPDFEATDKVYKQIIKPYLYGRGITAIDGVFLSHEDLDHYGSLRYMIEDFQVNEIILSSLYILSDEDKYDWTKNGTKMTRVEFRDQIIRQNQKFIVLSPFLDKQDANENSLVLYTELGGLRWLFTGDIGKVTEKEIINNFKQLNIDVLKVGHHGSNTSTDTSFIQHISPTYSFISVGVNNMYGHPAQEVIETLEKENVQVFRADMDGAVQYRFKKNQGSFTTYLKRKSE